ncbi:hypothetical protein ACQKGL_24375 [Ensifer adhaerens]|uniref:hypothetical protein n=1 Tax=Ensifer adhaerens TaxID=106592 RepID=UPI003CFCBF1D
MTAILTQPAMKSSPEMWSDQNGKHNQDVNIGEHHALAYRLWFSLLVFLMVFGVYDLLGLASMLLLRSMSLAAIVQMILIPIKSITLYPVLPVAMFVTAAAYRVHVSRGQDSGPTEPRPMAARSRKYFGCRS